MLWGAVRADDPKASWRQASGRSWEGVCLNEVEGGVIERGELKWYWVVVAWGGAWSEGQVARAVSRGWRAADSKSGELVSGGWSSFVWVGGWLLG